MLPSSQNMKFCITSSRGINKLALSNKSKLNILPFYASWVTMWLRHDQSKYYISSLICFLRWAHDLCWPIRLNPSDVRMVHSLLLVMNVRGIDDGTSLGNFAPPEESLELTNVTELGQHRVRQMSEENLVLMTLFELPKLSFSEFNFIHGCSRCMILYIQFIFFLSLSLFQASGLWFFCDLRLNVSNWYYLQIHLFHLVSSSGLFNQSGTFFPD